MFNFPQCMLDGWLYIGTGLKLEVALPRNERASEEVVYWIASVVKLSGYDMVIDHNLILS